MDDPENHNYGDSCYVGHSGSFTKFSDGMHRKFMFKLILRYTTLHIIYNSVHEDSSDDHWWRGCKPDHGEPLGCTQHNFEHHDHDELVDECVCKEELCNREMGPIETSTSVSTTTIKGNLLL